MADKLVPITREGKAKKQAELDQLFEQRRTVAARMHDSQEMGTSQNDAEYDDAKQEQGMVEGRIVELQDMLRRSVIIDEASAHKSGFVVIGSGVEVEQNGKTLHYQIVGAPEADPRRGKISHESPVGAALLGHSTGDTVDVHVPAGVLKVKILKID
jgi:transcription elongation factor GreA